MAASGGTRWRAPLGVVAIALLTTRSLLVLVGWYTARAFPPDPARVATEFRFAGPRSPAVLDAWTRWDAEWYVDIAVRGYRTRVPDAIVEMRGNFMPAYPYAVRALTKLGGGPQLSAMLLSNLALVVSLVLLHDWWRARTTRGHADALVWLYATFPTSFFLSAPYAESLTLAGLAGAWWAAENRRWVASGAFASLAVLSRPTGVVALAGLCLCVLRASGACHRARRSPMLPRGLGHALPPLARVLALPAVAVVGYLAWAHVTWGNALVVFPSQDAWRGATGWPWHAFVRYWEEGPAWHGWANSSIDAALAVASLVALPLVFARLGAAEGVLTAGLVLLPLGSGLVSFSRLVLLGFPLFALAVTMVPARPARFVGAIGLAVQLLAFGRYVAWLWVA